MYAYINSTNILSVQKFLKVVLDRAIPYPHTYISPFKNE